MRYTILPKCFRIALIAISNRALKLRQTITGMSEAVWPGASLALILGQFGFVVIVIKNDGLPFARQRAKESATSEAAQALDPRNDAGRTIPRWENDSDWLD